MNLRTDMPPEGKPFILFLFREPSTTIATKPEFCGTTVHGRLERIPLTQPKSFAWSGIAQLISDQGEACFVMAGTGKSEADGIEIEMDRGLRWAWAEIDDMSQGTVPWEGRES